MCREGRVDVMATALDHPELVVDLDVVLAAVEQGSSSAFAPS